LGELAEEERMIQELGRFFAQMNFRSIVSYNGKGFDLPILEGRFILYRQPFMLSELPHLDLLFSARSLWKHKHESCRLYHLAREIVEADRSEDIPSAEVPLRYFEYLRTSDFSLIEPILYHNQEDLLSLLGLVIVGSKLFPKSGKEVDEEFIDAMDLFGVAKVLENAGDSEKSVLFFQRALEGRLSSDTALAAKKRLARHFKKSHDWDKAVPLWQEMTKLDQLFCFRELAMHFEHRDKNYEEAKKIAEEGLALAMNVSESYQHDFAHRLERLDAKIAKKKENPGRR
jgi:tetratricopeptide (TPR) repeat protein